MRQHLLLLAGALTLAATAQAQTPGVGIGTTAPDVSAALDIVSSSKGVLLPRVADATALATPATGLIVFQTGGTAGFYYNAGTPAAPSWQQIATAAGAAITASNGLTKTGPDVKLGGPLTGSTTVDLAGNNLSFTGSGNVGVGTSAPAYPLDVVSGLRVSSPTATGGASLSQPTVNGGANLLNGQSFTLPAGTVVRSIVVYASSGNSGTLELYQGAPGSGTPLLTQAVTYTPGYGPTTVPLATPLTIAAPGVYSFRLTGYDYLSFAGSDPYAGGTAYIGTSAASSYDLRFDVNYDGPNAATLFAAPSGFVGVNTLTPTANLDVAGTTRLRGLAAPGVVLTDANGNLSSGSATSALGSNFIQNQTATDQAAGFRISGNGGLGGTLQFNSADADKIYLTYLGTAGSKIGHGAGWGMLNYAGPGTGGTTGFHSWLTTGGAGYQEQMRLTGSGLGIGTNSPGATLDVRGTANVSNSSGSFQLFQFGAAYNTVLMGGFVGLNSNGPQLRFAGAGAAGSFMDIGQSGTGDFVVEGSDAPRLTVQNGGRVGVGTSTPGALLDVQGGADNNGGNDPGALALSYRTGGYRHFLRSRHNSGLGGSGNDLDFYLNNSSTAEGSSAAGTGNVQVLTLENNNGQARVGIGTTAPNGRLHIVNDGGGGNQPDDYLIDEYGAGDQGLFLRRANGTAAAPTSLAAGDFIGQLTFVPNITAGLGYSGSSLTSYYQGDGTTLRTDLRLVTSGAEHLRLLPTGALWQLGTSNNVLLTTGTTTAPSGGGNVVLGNAVGGALTTGYQNVLLGQTAGNHLTTGYNNVLLGNGPGDALTTGADNIFIGASAGSGTTGSANIMVGGATGLAASTAEHSVFVGYASGNQTTGSDNTLVGFVAGTNTSTGTRNTALGYGAGYDNTTGSNNTMLGADTNVNAPGLTNATAVGAGARVSLSNSLILGNGANVGIGTSAPLTRLSISPTTVEPKLTLFDGGSTTNHYGFGVSNLQLNYHIDATTASHVFSVGGKNGDGTELLRVRGDGRVGVGTSNPSGQLANTSGNTIGSDAQGGNSGSLNWAATQNGYVGQLYNGGTTANGNGLAVKVDGTNANAVVLDLSKGAQTTTGTRLLTVQASGATTVGSLAGTGTRVVTANANGTLAATAALPVSESTTASNGLYLSGTDVRLGGALTQATTISGITATNTLDLTGTAAPTIINNTAAAAASTRVLGLRSNYSNVIAGSGAHLSFIEGNNFEVGRIASTQDLGSYLIGLSFSTTNGTAGTVLERLRISAAGRVGIGVSTPGAMLDVQGGADSGGSPDPIALAFSYRMGGFRHFVRSRHNGNVTGAGNDLDFYLNNGTTEGASSAPGTGNTHVLTMESYGGNARVGIGTTTPTTTLDVRGTTKLGTNGTTINAIIRATVSQTVGTINAGDAATVTFTVANVTAGGTANVSPANDLPNGVIISYARTANGSVIAKFFNANTSGSVNVAAGNYYITVVQ